MMKKSLSWVSFGALFFATALLLSAVFRFGEQNIRQLVAVDASPAAPIIILDAGHGGEDSGAIGKNGVLEKDLNLSVCQTLAALLRLSGYSVVESRTEDRLLCGDDVPKGHRKQTDLSGRLALTEAYPNCVLISIHMNTFPAADCIGTQVWYSEGNDASREWAAAIQAKVKETLQPQNDRRIKAATSGIYLLKKATCPAILIECGFLSTAAECERLCDPVYRTQLAMIFFAAIAQKSPLPSCNATLPMI